MADIKVRFPLPPYTDPTQQVLMTLVDQGDGTFAPKIASTGASASSGGAPTTVDYLVGTASGDLSAEIVVGTSPGGELGGTWGSPTVDATHSGSSHASIQTAAESTASVALAAHTAAADPHTGYLQESDVFDATAPVTQAMGDTAATGSATVASRRDHKHGMPAFGTGASDVAAGNHTHSGIGYSEGTSFPGGPATNAKFYRTDINELCYFDGTRWLTTQLYEYLIGDWQGAVNGIAQSTDYFAATLGAANVIWLVDHRWSYQVNTTHSSTQYWTMTLIDTSGSGSYTLTTDKSTVGSFITPTATAIGALWPSGTNVGGLWRLTKVSTPGLIYFGYAIRYRRVVT